jgi:plastocyanin
MESTPQRPRRAALATIVLAAAAALLLASWTSSQAATGPKATATGPKATASAAATVSISNFKFRPSTLSVAKGTRVVFSNASGVAHTATRGGSFDTRRIKPGGSVGVRFSQKGRFSYHCKIHPFMRGTIVVR